MISDDRTSDYWTTVSRAALTVVHGRGLVVLDSGHSDWRQDSLQYIYIRLDTPA